MATGRYDENGFWIYGEDDLADEGQGFSDVLNKSARAVRAAVPVLVHSRVVDELNSDPAIRESATLLFEEEIEGRSLAEAENLNADQLGRPQAGWRFAAGFSGNREVAFGLREDGTFYPQTKVEADVELIAGPLDISTGWRWAVAYKANREVIVGRRVDGTWYPATISETPLAAPVIIEGDSITEAWAAHVGKLSTKLGRSVTARGRGGQPSQYIAARQGGQPFRLTINGGKLPASTAEVAVTIAYPVAAAIAMPASTHVGVLAGVPSILQITGNGVGTIKAITAPPRPVPVRAGSPFITGMDQRGRVSIFWPGRNNPNPAQIVSDIKAMIAWAKPKDFIVYGVLPTATETNGSAGRANLEAIWAAQLAEWPTQFEDVATRLQSPDLMTAVGVTVTAGDETDIANGITPRSFRLANDDVHLNNAAYDALNLITEDIFRSKGL